MRGLSHRVTSTRGTRQTSRPRAIRTSSRTRSRDGRRTFIPYVLQEALDKGFYDELIPVAGPDGIAWSRRLAAEEGIFTGISGGSTFAVAMKLAETAPDGSDHAGHVAGHGRTLSLDTAFRGDCRRHDGGRVGDFAIHTHRADGGGVTGRTGCDVRVQPGRQASTPRRVHTS